MKKLLSVILVVLMALVCMPVKETFADDDGMIILWETDAFTDNHISDWGPARFAPEWRQSGEVMGSINDDQWEWMKKVTFYIDFEGPNLDNTSTPGIKICTGWWSNYLNDEQELPVYTEPSGSEVNCIINNGDNTFTIVLNLVDQNIITLTPNEGGSDSALPEEYIPLDYKDLGILSTNSFGGGVDILRIYFKDYKITKGNSITIRNKENEAVFTSDGPLVDLLYVEIDGEKIDEDKYALDNSTTKVTVDTSYLLNNYSNGTHIFSFVFKNGHADASFTIDKSSPTPTPETNPEPKHEILNTGVN